MGKEPIRDPLWEFGAFKDTLRLLFMNDEIITNLVMPELDNSQFTYEQNWKGGKYTKNRFGHSCKEVLVGHCFTHPYVEDTVTDTRSFICIETIYPNTYNPTFKDISLQIYIYSHHDILDLSDEEYQNYMKQGFAGNRCDMIMMAINRLMFNKDVCRDFGIGKVSFSERYPINTHVPNNKYYGRILNYNVKDFFLTPRIKEAFGLI